MVPKDIEKIFIEEFGIIFNNQGNTEYDCPACLKKNEIIKLDNPVLYLFKNYSCFTCRSPITVGLWPLQEYSQDKPLTYWGHETALHPAVFAILEHYGITLSFKYSSEAGFSYWRQICPHCKVAQGDYHIREYFNLVKSDPKLYEIHQCDILHCSRCLRTFEKHDLNNICFRCNRPVSEKVKYYCLSHEKLFKGNIYCYDCQRIIKQQEK